MALELAVRVCRAVEAIPRGHRGIADQAQRAAAAVVLLIAEGANRRSWPDKRNRYAMARGECGELAAAIELSTSLSFLDATTANDVLVLAGRVSAMLLQLERRMSRAPFDPPPNATSS